jgi:hypothetical protein
VGLRPAALARWRAVGARDKAARELVARLATGSGNKPVPE